MKSLFDRINEARGIVTNSDSWSGLVDFILSNPIVQTEITDNLPEWLHSVVIKTPRYVSGGIAAYDVSGSKMVGTKLQASIDINTAETDLRKLKVTLEHELQHAYDDYVARVKRHADSMLSDTYCMNTGYEGFDSESYKYVRLADDPKSCTCDSFFNLFSSCTYYFETTEVNAYTRELKMYLDQTLPEHDVDFNDIIMDSVIGEIAGGSLLQFIYIMHKTLQRIDRDQYPQGEDLVDYDYIKTGLHANWSKKYLGKNVDGPTSKDAVSNTIKYILAKKGKYAVDKIKRIIKDAGNHPHKLTNVPNFLK